MNEGRSLHHVIIDGSYYTNNIGRMEPRVYKRSFAYNSTIYLSGCSYLVMVTIVLTTGFVGVGADWFEFLLLIGLWVLKKTARILQI